MTIKNNSTSSDEQDEAFFEQYLQGESSLSELYQKTDCPESSDALDRRILRVAQTTIENTKSSNVVKPKIWQQPLSWAASIAIFSLAGLLTLNTWQSEQDNLEQDLLLPQASSEEYDVFSSSSSNATHFDSSSSLKKHNKPLSQSKKIIPQETSKDSRKLLYKSEAVPEMQTAPAYFGRSQINTKSKSKQNTLEPAKALSLSPAFMADERIEAVQSTQDAEQKQDKLQEIWLDRVRLLINKNEFDGAHELILQFRIKYPDYPIDPIILQNLAPY